MRQLTVSALLASVCLLGCGSSLQQADPSLEATCRPQPNAEPRCTQGADEVRVAAVHEGDSCANGRTWVKQSDFADIQTLRCEAPERTTTTPPVPRPPTTPQTDATCRHVHTPDGAYFRVVSDGGLDCATVANTISDWSANCVPDGSRCAANGYECRLDVAAGGITTCTSSGTELRFEGD